MHAAGLVFQLWETSAVTDGDLKYKFTLNF